MTEITEKKALREEYLLRRKEQPLSEGVRLSSFIEERLFALPEFTSAKRLALYASFDGEVATEGILDHAIGRGKEVFYPKADKDRKHLCFLNVMCKTDLTPGLFKIDEPDGDPDRSEAEVDTLDLIIVPGIVFDRGGMRVGYGKGFYDRVLNEAKAPKVGLAFDFQVLDSGEIPKEEHDVIVDILLTESGVWRF
ncbi:MAG: 5-formyltetrahydrofolate cyclo-ligase [Thermodesulfobacteriota bacterium]